MKTIALLAFILLCSINNLMAQNEWSFGPRIGIGFSNRAKGYDYCTGIVVGAFGEYRIKNFAVEADILYAQQGMRYGNMSRKDKCVLIPVKAKLYMPYLLEGLTIFAGPQLEIFPDKHTPYIPGIDWGRNPYRTTTASIVLGLGYRFDFGLDLAVNYNAGIISNIDDKDISDMNKVFQITVGYDLCRLFKLCK